MFVCRISLRKQSCKCLINRHAALRANLLVNIIRYQTTKCVAEFTGRFIEPRAFITKVMKIISRKPIQRERKAKHDIFRLLLGYFFYSSNQ